MILVALLAFWVGAMCGVILMACLAAAGRADEWAQSRRELDRDLEEMLKDGER